MKKLTLIILPLVFAVTTACVKKDKEFLGAEVKSVPADFYVIDDKVEAKPKVPSFLNGDLVHLEGAFSSKVTAKVTVKGLESGAQKVFNVTTQELNEEVFTWNGWHEGLHFFREGEKAVLDVSFYGTVVKYSDTITIQRERRFANEFTVLPQFWSFETFANWNTSWGFYGDPNKSTFTADTSSEVRPIHGKKTFKIQSIMKTANATGYLGGIADNAQGGFYKTIDGENLPADGSRIWFNIFIYGTRDRNAQLTIQLWEADAPRSAAMAGRTDAYLIEITDLNFEGWRQYSYRMSDVPLATYCLRTSTGVGLEGGGCGNRIRETDRLDYITIELENKNAVPEGTVLKTYVDAAFFTLDGKYDVTRY